MTDWHKLKIPPKEHLDVQILDGTENKNIVKVITSLASIVGDKVSYCFKLYRVENNGSLTLLEKNPKEPVFENE